MCKDSFLTLGSDSVSLNLENGKTEPKTEKEDPDSPEQERIQLYRQLSFLNVFELWKKKEDRYSIFKNYGIFRGFTV